MDLPQDDHNQPDVELFNLRAPTGIDVVSNSIAPSHDQPAKTQLLAVAHKAANTNKKYQAFAEYQNAYSHICMRSSQ